MDRPVFRGILELDDIPVELPALAQVPIVFNDHLPDNMKTGPIHTEG